MTSSLTDAITAVDARKTAKDIFTWVGAFLTSYGEEKAVEEIEAYGKAYTAELQQQCDMLAEALKEVQPHLGGMHNAWDFKLYGEFMAIAEKLNNITSAALTSYKAKKE